MGTGRKLVVTVEKYLGLEHNAEDCPKSQLSPVQNPHHPASDPG